MGQWVFAGVLATVIVVVFRATLIYFDRMAAMAIVEARLNEHGVTVHDIRFRKGHLVGVIEQAGRQKTFASKLASRETSHLEEFADKLVEVAGFAPGVQA